MPAEAELPEIPVYDVGRDFPIELARRVGVRGYDLLEMATARTPRPVLGLLDHLSRRWLVRNGSRYLAELDALAGLSRAPGLYYLNVQYEWGCTTAIKPAPEGRSARLLRTLDWNVAGIGRFVVAARIANPLGTWLSLTWPAFTGVLQAIAPGRFAAAINQPMPPRRVGLYSLDWLIAKSQVWRSPHIQPIHLLRRVFETAPDYAAARAMLETTPITTPAIFTLVGVRADEGVVVERRPTEASVLTDTHAANEWRTPTWQPGHHRAYENGARLAAMRVTPSHWDSHFGWLTWPLLNAETRLAMVAEPASGRLLARGYEAEQPATRTLDMTP